MDDDIYDEVAERYKFLVQPVRDLSKNWDIDISQFLEEYLAEKLSDRPSEDDVVDANGRRRLFNFSEAAIVINGTSNVYCRKVEYVHQLAADFFEALSANKVKRKPRARGTDEEDANEGDGDVDMIEEGVEDPENHRRRTNPYFYQLDDNSKEQMHNTFSQIFLKPRSHFPAISLAFTSLDVFEKRSLMLFSRDDEVIGKRDDFKMNTCFMHKGFALLDLKNIDFINVFTIASICAKEHDSSMSAPPSPSPPVIYENPVKKIDDNEFMVKLDKKLFDFADFTADMPFGKLESFDDLDTLGAKDFCKMSVDQKSFNLRKYTLCDDICFDGSDGEIPEIDSTPSLSQMHYEELVKYHLKNVRASSAANRTAAALEEPFEPMDLFEQRVDKARPLVINPKCTVMAAKQVEQRNKRIERECKSKDVPNVSLVKTYIDTQLFRRKIKKRSYVLGQFNSQLMDRALLALNELFYREEKRRAQMKKTREAEERLARRLARRTSMTQSASQISVGRGPSMFVPPSPPPPVIYEDPTEELAAEEVIDYLADLDEDKPLGDLLSVDDLEDTLGVQHYGGMNVSRKSINLRNDTFCDDTFFGEPIGEMPEIDPTRPISQMQYDELVKYHLKKFWAVDHEVTSKFAERVQKWEERITPRLEKEQKHREFNTRNYSTDLIGAFRGDVGSELSLEQAISCEHHYESYELSRYLLTSLILTNMGNVKIVNNGLNNIRIQLTNSERHEEMFDDEQRLIAGCG